MKVTLRSPSSRYMYSPHGWPIWLAETAVRPDHEVHLLLVNQAARLVQRLVGVASGIDHHELDLAAAGGVVRLLPVEAQPVDHVLAGRGERAGERGQHADADGATHLATLRVNRDGTERDGERRHGF